ncbi:hypothetical protein KSS87_012469 [Heliosperma pusillum]|nr:hypothetical protein KSS87_012469 [Heliosperma pusillum]
MKNGAIECSVCRSKLMSPTSKTVSRAYDRHRSKVSSKQRVLNVLLPILVYMSKVNGKFDFSPVSVNFLTELMKVLFAVVMLLLQARHQKVGEKPLLSVSTFVQAARNNVLLAVPAFLYAINNYLKFIMQLKMCLDSKIIACVYFLVQLYFNPATVKMLSNLKVLVIAVLLRIVMRRKFSIIQWEALALLLIGISVNQMRSMPEGPIDMGLPVATTAYIYTLIFITVPSMASVYNEYALKSQYDTSIYLQVVGYYDHCLLETLKDSPNLFLYGYGAIFNFLFIVGTAMVKDTILKKYSSTVATIFTGIASAVLFGHKLTTNFVLGISIVFISMHQFFSPLSKVKEESESGVVEVDMQTNLIRPLIVLALMKENLYFPDKVYPPEKYFEAPIGFPATIVCRSWNNTGGTNTDIRPK